MINRRYLNLFLGFVLIFALLCGGLFFFYTDEARSGFSMKVHDSVHGIIRPYAEALAEEVNNSGRLKRDYTLYAANFEETSLISRLEAYNDDAILWLGSHHNLPVAEVEKYGTVLASTPMMSRFLEDYGVEAPLFPIFFKEAPRAFVGKKFFAVIGNPPFIEDILQKKRIFYKKYSRKNRERIFAECSRFSGVFAEDTSFSGASLDVDPALLTVAAAGVPIGTPWRWPHTEEALNAFNDRINFYMYKDDAETLVLNMLSEPLHDEISERKKEAQELAYSFFYVKTAALFLLDYLDDKNKLERSVAANSVNIDIPVAVGHTGSGDFWLANDLKTALLKYGLKSHLLFFNSLFDYRAEVNIIVRGFLSTAQNLTGKYNIFYLAYAQFGQNEDNDMEIVADENEYLNEISDMIKQNKYDAFATASKTLTQKLHDIGINAYYIPQFTNLQKFYPDYDDTVKSQVLFVGANTFYRTAAKAVYNAGLPIDIYGPDWNGMAKAPYIDNRILRKYYSSAKIVLNDTKDGMKKYGFISNRIFDATASGGFVISDYMKEIEDIYGDSVVMYNSEEELISLVKYYLNPAHEEERLDKARRAREITLKYFTAEQAAARFEAIIRAVSDDKKH